eukprot:s873_g2.t1
MRRGTRKDSSVAQADKHLLLSHVTLQELETCSLLLFQCLLDLQSPTYSCSRVIAVSMRFPDGSSNSSHGCHWQLHVKCDLMDLVHWQRELADNLQAVLSEG